MALSVSTDLTRITDAEGGTWVKFGVTSPAIEPDYFIQGSNCYSLGVTTGEKGMTCDIGVGNVLNFNTTHKDKLVFVWVRCATPGAMQVIANTSGGTRIILGSGTTAPTTAGGVWSAWVIDGRDTFNAADGWVCYVIDPQSTPSLTYGGGVDKTAIRWFGATVNITATGVKGQNFGIDAIGYGRGELRVTGTVATAGEGFKEIAAVDCDTALNHYGIITKKRGIYYVRGKIILGDVGRINSAGNWTVAVATNVVTVVTPVAHNLIVNQVFNTNASWTNNAFMANLSGKTVATVPSTTSFTFALTQGNQGATTETNVAAAIGSPLTFSSYGETVIFETPHYWNATNIVASIPDASVGGTAGGDGATSYNGLAFVGNGVATTTIDFGIIVGTVLGRSGPSFGSFKNTNLTTAARTLATVTTDNNASAVNIYGTTFNNLEGAIDLKGTNISNKNCFSVTFNACGRVNSNMALRNCYVLNSIAAADDGALIWDSTTNVQSSSFVNCSRAVVFEATTGTPFTFTSLTFSGNVKDVRNESLGAITITCVSCAEPTHEEVGGGSATTFSSSVSITLTGLQNPTEVRVFDAGTTTERAGTGAENVTTGSHSFSIPSGTAVDISIMALTYQDMRMLAYSTTVNATIPISQVVDRQYANP